MDDQRYTWGELLASIRAYWSVRHHGSGEVAMSRMVDVSRAYDQLDTEERIQLFLGVWLERSTVPNMVIQKMKIYLNEGVRNG